MLDLKLNPRKRLDERGITGLLGNIFVPIAHGIGIQVPTLQGDHAVNEYRFKSFGIAVAHLRYGEFDRKTLKPLE